jgi:hypothetical protein
MEAMVELFAPDGQISLEGDLSMADVTSLYGVQSEPNEIHKRTTISPKPDFALVPLTLDNVANFKRSIFPRVGLSTRVIHVLISKGDRMVFWSYDNFHPECVGSTDDVPKSILQDLTNKGVLKEFREEDRSNN